MMGGNLHLKPKSGLNRGHPAFVAWSSKKEITIVGAPVICYRERAFVTRVCEKSEALGARLVHLHLLVDSYVCQALHNPTRPADFNRRIGINFPQAKVHPWIAGGQI